MAIEKCALHRQFQRRPGRCAGFCCRQRLDILGAVAPFPALWRTEQHRALGYGKVQKKSDGTGQARAMYLAGQG
ncbi:hypothetical protein PG988_008938 [Apiospora saccharicola]